MKYWIFLENQVQGPLDAENLPTIRGFSPTTLVCPEGKAGDSSSDWTRAALIAEIAPLFAQPQLQAGNEAFPREQNASPAAQADALSVQTLPRVIEDELHENHRLIKSMEEETARLRQELGERVAALEARFAQESSETRQTLARQEDHLARFQEELEHWKAELASRPEPSSERAAGKAAEEPPPVVETASAGPRTEAPREEKPLPEAAGEPAGEVAPPLLPSAEPAFTISPTEPSGEEVSPPKVVGTRPTEPSGEEVPPPNAAWMRPTEASAEEVRPSADARKWRIEEPLESAPPPNAAPAAAVEPLLIVSAPEPAAAPAVRPSVFSEAPAAEPAAVSPAAAPTVTAAPVKSKPAPLKPAKPARMAKRSKVVWGVLVGAVVVFGGAAVFLVKPEPPSAPPRAATAAQSPAGQPPAPAVANAIPASSASAANEEDLKGTALLFVKNYHLDSLGQTLGEYLEARNRKSVGHNTRLSPWMVQKASDGAYQVNFYSSGQVDPETDMDLVYQFSVDLNGKVLTPVNAAAQALLNAPAAGSQGKVKSAADMPVLPSSPSGAASDSSGGAVSLPSSDDSQGGIQLPKN